MHVFLEGTEWQGKQAGQGIALAAKSCAAHEPGQHLHKGGGIVARAAACWGPGGWDLSDTVQGGLCVHSGYTQQGLL